MMDAWWRLSYVERGYVPRVNAHHQLEGPAIVITSSDLSQLGNSDLPLQPPTPDATAWPSRYVHIAHPCPLSLSLPDL